MAFAHFEVSGVFKGGAVEKVGGKNPIGVSVLLVKAKQHKPISSAHLPLPLLVLRGRAGRQGGGEGGAENKCGFVLRRGARR